MSEYYGQGSGDDPWLPGGDPPPAWAGDPSSSSPLLSLLEQLRDRPLNRLSRRLRRLRARSDQLARRDPSAVPNVFVPASGAAASSAPRRRRRRRRRLRVGGERFFLSLLLVTGMLLPFTGVQTRFGESAPTTFVAGSPQETLYESLDVLTPGDLVLVGMEYGPTAAGELDTVAGVLLRHILLRRAVPIVVSRYPVTLLRTEQMLTQLGQAGSSLATRLQRDVDLVPNADWFVTRFLAGDLAGLRALSMNLREQLAMDLRGSATGLDIRQLGDFARVLVIAERPEDLRQWAEQIAPLAGSDMLAATGQAAVPLARPWLRVALSGTISGFHDALTYDSMLLQQLEVSVGPPSAPRNLRALSLDESIELEWDRPLSNGGSPITGYTIRHLSTPYLTWVEVPLTGSDTTHTLTGLDNGTAYDIQVRASNAEGDGPWSRQITDVPRSVPSQAQSLTLTAGDASVEASWSAPADDGGSALTGYRLRWRTGTEEWRSADTAADVTTYTATGLTNGDAWEFQVRAVNQAGAGDWSAAETATPLAGAQALANAAADSQQAPAVATATPGIFLGTVRAGASELSLRDSADAAGALLGIVNPGENVQVLLRNAAASWLFLQTNDGLRGWLPAASLDLGPVDIRDVPAQAAPQPTATPGATATTLPAGSLSGTAAQAPGDAGPADRPGTILQAAERESSIHIGLALSIVMIALGALGNMGSAALRRGRRG
ncbi:MAG: fibronectin type III domain-containing protein [Anaerolineaceae bacterium]|nr:fibronectin type III domain-containing protein [Anaerolineaceae bacterium]